MSQLPELPEPEDVDNVRWAYTADQMHAFYAQAIVSVKREPLSEAQIENIAANLQIPYFPDRHWLASERLLTQFGRAIEQAHGIGGEGDGNG